MSANIKYFDNIPASPKRDMILLRLGYNKSSTVLNEKDMEKLEEGIKLGKILCNPRGAFGRFGIVERNEKTIRLENGSVLESESLAKLLAKSGEVVLMASTVGREVTDRISAEVENGDAASGLILDSVASQTADSVLDWMMGFIDKLLSREGRKLTRHRYSPGFGDLTLSNQKIIFEILELEKLGLELTPRFMLVPEKSVIAIAGIERID